MTKNYLADDDCAKNTAANKRVTKLTIEEINAKFNEISEEELLDPRRYSASSFNENDMQNLAIPYPSPSSVSSYNSSRYVCLSKYQILFYETFMNIYIVIGVIEVQL